MLRSKSERSRKFLVLIASLLLSLGPMMACKGKPQNARGRRIVLLTLDTLRWDSFYESTEHQSQMPLSLARARRGLLFSEYYSAANITQPAHAAILTGKQPWNLGIFRNGMSLQERYRTIAEEMRSAGWHTGAVVGSFPVSQRFGFGQGFDSFKEAFSHSGHGKSRWEGHEVPESGFFGQASDVTGAAIKTLDEMTGLKQFFWFQYFDPHSPYGDSTDTPGPSIRRVRQKALQGEEIKEDLKKMRSGYDHDVSFLDLWLDRLFSRLEEDGTTYETWVIGVSDHGESFGEGGSLGHGQSLGEEQIHVPLFIFQIGENSLSQQQAVCRTPVGSVDVAETILALADLPGKTKGRNLFKYNGIPEEIYGMRRVFRPGRREIRTDGRKHVLPEFLFFCAEPSGTLVVGNAKAITKSDTRLPPGNLGKIQRHFAEIEERIQSRKNEGENLDPESRRGLEALGYLDPAPKQVTSGGEQ